MCYSYDPANPTGAEGEPTAPANFNGLMIIGEGPGHHEVQQGRPFVGPSGRLLRDLLDTEGVDMDQCYVTNATLCQPDPGKGSLLERAPGAVHACLPRLETEIAHVKPRVILAFGNAALAALTGYEEPYTKQEPLQCDYCADSHNEKGVQDRKVLGVQCTLGTCGHVWEPHGDTDKPDVCPQCGANWRRLRVRRVKCPQCGGRKTHKVEHVRFEYDYKIGEVAGGIIYPEKHGWDEFGVRYMLASYHPSFLLRGAKPTGSGEKKVMAGQFAVYAVMAHIRKAKNLLRQGRDWSFEYEVTPSHGDVVAADMLYEYIYPDAQLVDYPFATDIETKATGFHYLCAQCDKKHDHVTHGGAGKALRLTCEVCGERAWHKPREAEFDARKVEFVTDITCIGFASRKRGHALVVDTRRLDQMPELALALRHVLTDRDVKKCFHNGTYDTRPIEALWGYAVEGYSDDTLIAHHDVHADETHTLAHLAGRYSYAPVWKPPKRLRGGVLAHESFEELAEYNAKDVMITDEARERLMAELESEGLHHIYELDMQLQAQALEMRRNGLPFNYEAARDVGRKAYDKKRSALAAMRKIVGDDFNPNSPGQLRQALIDQGYVWDVWTDGGKSGNKQLSTAEHVLKQLADSPFKRDLLEYREHADLLKRYFDIREGDVRPGRGLDVWEDGRVHATWKPFGTVTGRYTSNPNLQNLLPWMLAMFVAPEGRKIVGADYDQLELRILAALCGDEELCRRCLEADETRKLDPECDPHSYVASFAFGAAFTALSMDYEGHNKNDERCKCQTCQRKHLRDLCKRVVYGLNYGAGAATVLESIYSGGWSGPPLRIEMIEKVKDTIFNEAYKGIQPWQQAQIAQANHRRELRSPILGRRREFPLVDIPITEVFNFPIQSGGADIINLRSTLFWRRVREVDPSALYLAQVHDAIYYEVAEDCAQEVAALMSETLSWRTSLFDGGPEMLFSAQAVIADNWKDAK